MHNQSIIIGGSEQTISMFLKLSVSMIRLIPKDFSPENKIRVPKLFTYWWKFCSPLVLKGNSVSYSADNKYQWERASCSWVNPESYQRCFLGCSSALWSSSACIFSLFAIWGAQGVRGSSLGSPQLWEEVAALPELIKVVGFSLANFALDGLGWFVESCYSRPCVWEARQWWQTHGL